MTKYDWQEIVDRKPKGYLELNDGSRVLCGPIVSVKIDEIDFVVITLKWTAIMPLVDGVPNGDWVVAPNESISFPNLMVPYEEEDTLSKGPCIRFGFNILYFDAVEGLDPAQVRGLVIPETTHAERRQEDDADDTNRGLDSIGQ